MHLYTYVCVQTVDVQPCDGFLTLLPLETVSLDVIVSPIKPGVSAFLSTLDTHCTYTACGTTYVSKFAVHSCVFTICTMVTYIHMYVHTYVRTCSYVHPYITTYVYVRTYIVYCILSIQSVCPIQPFSFDLTCMTANGRLVCTYVQYSMYVHTYVRTYA